MASIKKRIQNILEHLEQVNEDLLALSDDIWLSIDHNDTKVMEEGVKFKSEYNDQLTKFGKLSDSLSKLIQDFTDSTPEHEEAEKKESKENERIIKKLNKNDAHYLSEDLTYKRPYGFSIKGKAYYDVRIWKKVYSLFLMYLKDNESEFQNLKEVDLFISNRGTKSFSAKPDELRSPIKIANNFYAETNLSANHISNKILDLMKYFGYDEKDFIVYLREDRDFKK